jgi:hypothetical protein
MFTGYYRQNDVFLEPGEGLSKYLETACLALQMAGLVVQKVR